MKKYLFILFLFIIYNICCIAQEGEVVTPQISIPDSLVFVKSGALYIKYLITKNGDIGKYYIDAISLVEKDEYKDLFDKRFPKKNKKIGLVLVKRLQKWVDDFVKKSRFEKSLIFYDQIKKLCDQYLSYGVRLEFGDYSVKSRRNRIK